MKAYSRWAVLAAALAISSGCGLGGDDDRPKTVEAKGIVTLDGAPIEGASIVFAPVEPGEGKYPAQARSDATGNFELTAFESKPGAVPGQYKVMVSRTVEVTGGAPPTAEQLGEDAEHMTEEEKAGVRWVNDLPQKYANPNDSGIVIEIPESGIANIELKLVSE